MFKLQITDFEYCNNGTVPSPKLMTDFSISNLSGLREIELDKISNFSYYVLSSDPTFLRRGEVLTLSNDTK